MRQILPFYGKVSKTPTMQEGKTSGKKYLRLSIYFYGDTKDGDPPLYVQMTFYEKAAENIIEQNVKEGTMLLLYGTISGVDQFPSKNDPNTLITVIRGNGHGWVNTNSKKPQLSEDPTSGGAPAPAGAPSAPAPAAAAAPPGTTTYDMGDDGELPF